MMYNARQPDKALDLGNNLALDADLTSDLDVSERLIRHRASSCSGDRGLRHAVCTLQVRKTRIRIGQEFVGLLLP